MIKISIRQLRALFGVLALLGALAAQEAAAAPLMTYQGRLKESGLPVSGTKSIDVLLCNCSSGVCAPACSSSGAQLVSVSSGLFRTTFTVPSNVDLNAGAWYLEVQVGGTPLFPREQLTNSPYAVVASSATGLAAAPGAAGVSVSTSLFITSGGGLGIGTTSPTLNVSLGNTGPRTLGVEDTGAVTAPGQSLTVQSGGGGTLATGGLGGNLILKAGSAGGGGNNNGGNVVLTAGDKTGGTGNAGAVEINGNATAASAAHLRATQTTAPSLGGFGLCGTGPTINIAATSTDMHGSFTFVTGTGSVGPACGANITFNRAYAAVPRAILISPGSAAAADPGQNGKLYVSGLSATGFSVVTVVGPPPSTTLTWYYVVIE